MSKIRKSENSRGENAVEEETTRGGQARERSQSTDLFSCSSESLLPEARQTKAHGLSAFPFQSCAISASSQLGIKVWRDHVLQVVRHPVCLGSHKTDKEGQRVMGGCRPGFVRRNRAFALSISDPGPAQSSSLGYFGQGLSGSYRKKQRQTGQLQTHASRLLRRRINTNRSHGTYSYRDYIFVYTIHKRS